MKIVFDIRDIRHFFSIISERNLYFFTRNRRVQAPKIEPFEFIVTIVNRTIFVDLLIQNKGG